ncbi:MAG: NAD-dependent epimerase/dehydratase family protein [Ignavibacteriales bacterium]|nr:NAD-dependent epimerase/dehydratase family protein [Ignavibacteriales bacterium]
MINVVTGAFGYIGKYIARRLLESGEQVRTITTHTEKPNPFRNAVQAFPYSFDKPELLTSYLRGARVLYNTYWIRFEYGNLTFQKAVENTRILMACARAAGIEKIVHISVTCASPGSALPYYAGKGLQEIAVVESGIPYAIVRPTLVFGAEDILMNNIAWLMRKFPVFPIFGSGNYRVQPVFVEDLTDIAVSCSIGRESSTLDAIGPESFTFKEMVQLIASKIKPNVKLVHVAPVIGIALGKIIGFALRDKLLTRDELKGLMDGLLTSSQAPNGATRFSEWIEANKKTVGSRYSSELARHFKWSHAA